MQLRGCGTALVTPFRQDGSIDESAFRNLVAWQVESGIDFLVPCGTTGETPTFPMTNGCGSSISPSKWRPDACRLWLARRRTRPATRWRRPRKWRRARGGCDPHCLSLLQQAYAGRTVPAFPRDCRSGRQADHSLQRPRTHWRESGAGYAGAAGRGPEHRRRERSQRQHQRRLPKSARLVPETFLVFSGDDAVTLAGDCAGRSGYISVASNEIPREMAQMTRAALNNDWDHCAAKSHRKYLPLMQANFIESSPLPVKAVLAMMGKIEEVYRLPLVPMRRDTRSKLQKIATEAGLVAKPAAPVCDAVEFFVYENWLAGPHKIVLHRSSCGQCNHGKGRPAGHDANHARWHGPYTTLTEARRGVPWHAEVLIRSECKCI